MDNQRKESLVNQDSQGQEAESLLNNKLLQQFFQDFQDRVARLLWECPSSDSDKLKALLEQKEAMVLFRGYFESYVLRGKQALEILKIKD